MIDIDAEIRKAQQRLHRQIGQQVRRIMEEGHDDIEDALGIIALMCMGWYDLYPEAWEEDHVRRYG
jgi:hypothetical protein